MRSDTSNISATIKKLADGWRKERCELADEIIHLWKESLGAVIETKDVDDNEVRFRMDLGAIRLLGMNDVYCLLVGGASPQAAKSARRFWSQVSDAGRMVMVLAGSETLYRQIESAIPRDVCVILGPQHLERILKDGDPRIQFKNVFGNRSPGSCWCLLISNIQHPVICFSAGRMS
jgi:hypothetical protein